ncbi:sterol desaturase [Natronolimnohabitans sp. A-GB9]|uniref:sterol desaturase n=1 Tax=Natronolimnohabitans sp. A-GB9 TaxID=3069757 RepID=UPI0027AE06A5|nr:sterol desaturase [Natronolimnohabitans sp. A-GB9]MDQ2051732.1 sterol desaturase [Natronolimnohabitans sp. A-GB9]
MNQNALYALVGILVVLVVSSGLYWYIGNFGLAAVTGVTWGVALLLLVRADREYPDSMNSWWSVLGVGFIISLAALLGVSPTLPIAGDIRFGLGLLVMGTGLAAYVAGVMTALEPTESSG